MAQKSTSEVKLICSKEPPHEWDGSPAEFFLAHFTEPIGNVVQSEVKPGSSSNRIAEGVNDHVFPHVVDTDVLPGSAQRIAVLIQCSAQQQLVIRLKYYENQDCAAIAEMMNIKRGRVYSPEDQALIQLRRAGITAGLGQFLSDDISYYSGTGVRQFTATGFSSTERLALKHIAMENRFAAWEASCIE